MTHRSVGWTMPKGHRQIGSDVTPLMRSAIASRDPRASHDRSWSSGRAAAGVDRAIPDREPAAFRALPAAPGEGECILVTNDYEDVIAAGAARVACVPLVKLLLDL